MRPECKLTAQQRAVCTKPLPCRHPDPFCAPLQVEETELEMLSHCSFPIGCVLSRFNLLSARLSESGPCHLITLIETSESRLPYAMLHTKHAIGVMVGVTTAIFKGGTLWRL